MSPHGQSTMGALLSQVSVCGSQVSTIIELETDPYTKTRSESIIVIYRTSIVIAYRKQVIRMTLNPSNETIVIVVSLGRIT